MCWNFAFVTRCINVNIFVISPDLKQVYLFHNRITQFLRTLVNHTTCTFIWNSLNVLQLTNQTWYGGENHDRFFHWVTEDSRSSWLQTLGNHLIHRSPYIRYTNHKYYLLYKTLILKWANVRIAQHWSADYLQSCFRTLRRCVSIITQQSVSNTKFIGCNYCSFKLVLLLLASNT